MPHRGEDTGLENHYVPMRGNAIPSILTFFAQAVKSRLLCYSDATGSATEPREIAEVLVLLVDPGGRIPT